MAQISSLGALPDPTAHLQAGTLKTGAAGKGPSTTKPTTTATTGSDEAESSPLQTQLTRLSAVLNGLQATAATNRTQYVQTLNKVKSGTYQVDSAEVSRSIVDDALGETAQG
jgi:anti-sigma28 factor (negative regulator of flagellin synthesis)